MRDQRMAPSQSVSAYLDALVLEEVNALDTPRGIRSAPPTFSSEDDFVAEAVAYLRQRDEPQRVIADLTRELGLSMSEDLDLPDDLEPPEDVEPPEGLDHAKHAADANGQEAPAPALAATPGDAEAPPQSRPGS